MDHYQAKRRADDAKRGSGSTRGWSAKWAKFRERYLSEHPRCECDDCTKLPYWQRPVATDIDHVDGCGRNGSRAYDETNLRAMSHACHSRKTAAHDGSFGRKINREEAA